MKIKYKLFLILFIILVSVYRVFSQTPMNSQEMIVAGDAVRIQIWQLYDNVNNKSPISNLSSDYKIDNRGYIYMPFVGLVQVGNKRPKQVEELIKKKYENLLTDPFIYVRPLIRVTIRGQVSKPGSYRVDPQISFWDLMEFAGGPTARADLKKMHVIRSDRKVVGNLLQAFESAYSLTDLGIQSGDQVLVAPKGGISIRSVMNTLTFAASMALLIIRIDNLK